ncbi:MAG: ABC transporter [Actinomycetia bacterium]|nr:ABC transporter [Actinomycetes bacterium]
MTTTAVPAGSERARLLPYALAELRTTLSSPDMILFTTVLPLGLYLFFGALSDYRDESVGHGNIASYTMVCMSVFSVSMVATAVAGGSAVELAGGWGRQMSLTPWGVRGYYLVKTLCALLVSLVPLSVIFVAGWLTGARCGSLGVWAASYLACLLPALPFSLYGLAAGMWFRSNQAVGTATASLALWGFLSNTFMPLGGVLFQVSHLAPLYGCGMLALRPLLGDSVITSDGLVTEPLWLPLANLTAWTLLLALVCLVSRHRAMARR